MRILVVTGRYPAPGLRGDQTRLYRHLRWLGQRHRLTVVTTEPPPGESARRLGSFASVVVVPSGSPRRALSAATAPLRGVPGQTGLMMPARAWRAALREAPGHDVALVNTARSLRGPLPIPMVVDHVDALSYNMEVRARGPEALPRRAAARVEARLMRGWERRIAGWSAAQVVTSADVGRALHSPPEPEVIPVAWEGELFEEPAGHVRDIDVIFTGDMRYPPNRQAAVWLAEEIVPRIRAERPGATAWIVGRYAGELGLSGIEFAENVPDLHAYLRRAKVALAPMLEGSGSPFKVIEAAASGTAVVAAPWTVECYGMEAETAETADEFAAGAVRLLEDGELRERRARAGREAVERHGTDRLSAELERILARAAGSAAVGAPVAAL